MNKKELEQAITIAQFNRANAYKVSSAEAIRFLAKYGLDAITFLTIMGMSLNQLSKMTQKEKIELVVRYITGELK